MKPVALVAKQLTARLAFLSTLIVLLPLAVLNRQSVSISLNPMDLLRDVPQGQLEMPLFIALFALFILGLLLGWLMGRLGKNRRKRAPGLPRVSGSSGSSDSMRSRRTQSAVIDNTQDETDAVLTAAPPADASVGQDLVAEETGSERRK